MKLSNYFVLIMLFVLPRNLIAGQNEISRVKNATEVLSAIGSIPEKKIPPKLIEHAEGLIIIPGVIKAGFVIGGRHGRGIMIARQEDESWSQPIFVELIAGSVGWQIGVQSTDVVLIVRHRQSMMKIFDGEFTLGADATIAAGPVGRHVEASTDTEFKAEIYSYSQSKGLFAGISFEGSQIKIDHNANAAYYGDDAILPEDIVAKPAVVQPATRELHEVVDNFMKMASDSRENWDRPDRSLTCQTRLNAARTGELQIARIEAQFVSLIESVAQDLAKDDYPVKVIALEPHLTLKSGHLGDRFWSNYRQEARLQVGPKEYSLSLISGNLVTESEQTEGAESSVTVRNRAGGIKLPFAIVAGSVPQTLGDLERERIRYEQNQPENYGNCVLPPVETPVLGQADLIAGYIYDDQFLSNYFAAVSAMLRDNWTR